jgi:hypothetical protein
VADTLALSIVPASAIHVGYTNLSFSNGDRGFQTTVIITTTQVWSWCFCFLVFFWCFFVWIFLPF